MEGYFYGVLDLVCAKMTKEDTAATAPEYDKVETLAKTIEVTITPKYRTGSVYASNIQTRAESRVNTYEVSMNADKVPYLMQAKLYGRKTDENGVQIISGDDIPPYYAVGFAATLDNGEQELWWLYKGKFSEGARTAKTAGENLEYQHPTITATFVRRADNNALAATVETGVDGVGEEVKSSWFEQVYEPQASADTIALSTARRVASLITSGAIPVGAAMELVSKAVENAQATGHPATTADSSAPANPGNDDKAQSVSGLSIPIQMDDEAIARAVSEALAKSGTIGSTLI